MNYQISRAANGNEQTEFYDFSSCGDTAACHADPPTCGHGFPPEDEDPAYLAYLEEMERMCGRSIIIGTEDGTSCELDNGHDGRHRGRNPFDEGYVEWTGGGMCAGDPLPVRDMRFTS